MSLQKYLQYSRALLVHLLHGPRRMQIAALHYNGEVLFFTAMPYVYHQAIVPHLD